MSDFVDQADVVALIELGQTESIPDVSVQDYAPERLVASATVVKAVKGVKQGDQLKLFHAVRSTNPEKPEQAPRIEDTRNYPFTEGDRLIVALEPVTKHGERRLVTPDAFFVDRDGVLDPELAATRDGCSSEPKPLFQEAISMTTDELLSAAAREV